MNLTANDLLRLKIIDGVVEEPVGGAHKDYDTAAKYLADAVEKALDEFKTWTPKQLREQRYEHFRSVAFYNEPAPEEEVEVKDPAAVEPAPAKKTKAKK